MTTHLLVADDHRIVLQGIRTLLSALPGVLIDTATTADGVLRALTASPYSYSVAVVDLDLPGAHGTSLLAAIADRSAHTRVIVYTMHEELWVARQLQQVPLAGVVLKSEPPALLLAAVASVREGGEYLSPRFRAIVDQALTCGLSARETAVLELLAQGLPSREIATRLCLSENTIEYYRKRLMRRFCARNMVDMVQQATREGLLRCPPMEPLPGEDERREKASPPGSRVGEKR